jgi:Zn finger protein HypA/HybF involved in hydrogenase expression
LSRNQTAPQKGRVVLACPRCHRTFEPTRIHGGAAIEMKKLGTDELLIRRETVKVICLHCDHDFMVNKSLLPDGLGSKRKR